MKLRTKYLLLSLFLVGIFWISLNIHGDKSGVKVLYPDRPQHFVWNSPQLERVLPNYTMISDITSELKGSVMITNVSISIANQTSGHIILYIAYPKSFNLTGIRVGTNEVEIERLSKILLSDYDNFEVLILNLSAPAGEDITIGINGKSNVNNISALWSTYKHAENFPHLFRFYSTQLFPIIPVMIISNHTVPDHYNLSIILPLNYEIISSCISSIQMRQEQKIFKISNVTPYTLGDVCTFYVYDTSVFSSNSTLGIKGMNVTVYTVDSTRFYGSLYMRNLLGDVYYILNEYLNLLEIMPASNVIVIYDPYHSFRLWGIFILYRNSHCNSWGSLWGIQLPPPRACSFVVWGFSQLGRIDESLATFMEFYGRKDIIWSLRRKEREVVIDSKGYAVSLAQSYQKGIPTHRYGLELNITRVLLSSIPFNSCLVMRLSLKA